MSGVFLAQAILLVISVTSQLLCCAGMLLLRDPFDRLHLQGPSSILGPLCIAIAIALDGHFATAGIKALITALFVLVTNPLITYYTANALLIRDPSVAAEEKLQAPKI